jgi:hypothetical protein
MSKRKHDQAREDRIDDEIVVDCYDDYEVAAGWCAYLEDHLPFPFQATYHPENEKPRQVTVLALEYDEDELEEVGLVFVVEIEDDGEEMLVPLEDITPPASLPKAAQAIEDWRYWSSQ